MSLGTDILALLDGLGPTGLLLALFVIFYVDAMVFPLLPEVFAIFIFQAGEPTLEWALVVLFLAETAEVLGNATLYAAVKHFGLPRRIKAAMNKWTEVLLAKRETLILTNRIAPAVPFVGAFIAGCEWDFRKSVFYIAVGGLVKYSLLLLLVATIWGAYPADVASNITLVAIVVFVAVSAGVAYARRRRMEAPKTP